MGTQKSGTAGGAADCKKVHCRGGCSHPPGNAPAAANGYGLAPASAETKEKPLAERIGKGLSLSIGDKKDTLHQLSNSAI